MTSELIDETLRTLRDALLTRDLPAGNSIPLPGPDETVRWGLCDGIHRDDHEFVPA